MLTKPLIYIGKVLSRVIWRLERRGFPLSRRIMGRRVTIYSWGMDINLAQGILVVVWGGSEPGRVYVSSDGTPARATRNIIGRTA